MIGLFITGIAILSGMFWQFNAGVDRVDRSVNTLQTTVNANDNATRNDIQALDSRIDALSLEAAKTNAQVGNIESDIEDVEKRLVNIERQFPNYHSVDARLNALEFKQARISELIAELVNSEYRVRAASTH